MMRCKCCNSVLNKEEISIQDFDGKYLDMCFNCYPEGKYLFEKQQKVYEDNLEKQNNE